MKCKLIAPAVVFTICGAVQAQPRFNLYDMGDLGALQGLTSGYSAGQSINANGVVAGNAFTPDIHNVGFRTGPGGIGLGASSLLGLDSEARAINASGQVAGMFQIGPDTNFVNHAFRTSATGLATDSGADLGTLPGGNYSKAFGINDSGQVVGIARDAAGKEHAFRTSATGTIADPGADLGVNADAMAINSSGQVTGSMAVSTNAHAYRTTPTGTVATAADLGTLGGSRSFGTAINVSGQVTGNSDTSTGQIHAFRTTTTGLVSDPNTDLGLLPGGDNSEGTGINALGHVVGLADISSGGTDHAFYDTDQMYDLNNLIVPGTGWMLRRAFAINDNDWITGDAIVNGGIRGFLLIPVDNDPGLRPPIAGIPEPSPLALGTLAAAIAARFIRRHRPVVTAA
jgi:probable HAF family extracellular repeat protein